MDGDDEPIDPSTILLCQETIKQLVSTFSVDEPILCPVGDGSIDMNWEGQGVYCTLTKGMLQIVTRPLTRPIKPEEIKFDDFDIPEKMEDAKCGIFSPVACIGTFRDIGSLIK